MQLVCCTSTWFYFRKKSHCVAFQSSFHNSFIRSPCWCSFIFCNVLCIFLEADISMIKLDKEVEFTSKIQPACLPAGNRNYVGEVGTTPNISWDLASILQTNPAIFFNVAETSLYQHLRLPRMRIAMVLLIKIMFCLVHSSIWLGSNRWWKCFLNTELCVSHCGNQQGMCFSSGILPSMRWGSRA